LNLNSLIVIDRRDFVGQKDFRLSPVDRANVWQLSNKSNHRIPIHDFLLNNSKVKANHLKDSQFLLKNSSKNHQNHALFKENIAFSTCEMTYVEDFLKFIS